MMDGWRSWLWALRRSTPLAREIAAILVIKTLLLTWLMHSLARPPAPGGPEKQNRAAQHLLGVQLPSSGNKNEHRS